MRQWRDAGRNGGGNHTGDVKLVSTARQLAALDIYVVEDNAQTRRMIATVLRTLGVGSVRDSGDARTALAEVRHKAPGIVISDWEMSPMGGAQFLRELRHESSGAAAKVPVIVLSAHSNLAVIRSALEAGANQFLAKPVVPGKLLERIEFVLNDRRQLVLQNGHYAFAPAAGKGAAPPDRGPSDSGKSDNEAAWEID